MMYKMFHPEDVQAWGEEEYQNTKKNGEGCQEKTNAAQECSLQIYPHLTVSCSAD